MAKNKSNDKATTERKVRAYVRQTDVPGTSLDDAIRIPAAIGDNYGFKPSTPFQVAKALNVQPSTGPFRMLTGAAVAYGLTLGAYNAERHLHNTARDADREADL